MGNCYLLNREGRIDMGAVIEAHNDIRIVADLQLNGFFGREVKFTVGTFRFESDAIVIQVAKAGVLLNQRICLETARVGDDGLVPPAHFVQAPQRLDRR